jgi:hypothetical protein
MSILIQQTLSICPACGEPLGDSRANKRFHDSACRARFWRMKRDANTHAMVAQKYINEIASLASDPDNQRDVWLMLHAIERTIKRTLVEVERLTNVEASDE